MFVGNDLHLEDDAAPSLLLFAEEGSDDVLPGSMKEIHTGPFPVTGGALGTRPYSGLDRGGPNDGRSQEITTLHEHTRPKIFQIWLPLPQRILPPIRRPQTTLRFPSMSS